MYHLTPTACYHGDHAPPEFNGRRVVAALPGFLSLPSADVAYSLVALYLRLEMLSHLDGDRDRALALFHRARQLAALAEVLGFSSPAKEASP